MARTAMIRARTNEKLKAQVEGIFTRLGVTASEAINLFYHQVQPRKGLPFAVEIPNAETRNTFEKTDRNEDVHTHRSASAMFRKLGI
jgi:DNA-damage-inducible protein J